MLDLLYFVLIFSSGKSQPEVLTQYSVVLKAILSDLQERREDCDKLREKLERLEVIVNTLFI